MKLIVCYTNNSINVWNEASLWHRYHGFSYCGIADKNGLYYKEWGLDDKLHRTDGPAVIQFRHGAIIDRQYWVSGKGIE